MKSEKPRIVLVEDSRTQALQIQHVLEEAGFEVVIAVDGEGALEEIDRSNPDLVLSDFYLPGIRGDELCRRLRMSVNTRGLPVLLFTVDSTHEAELRGLDSGADDFVPKSVVPDELVLRIRALLKKTSSQPTILDDHRGSLNARILAVDDSPTYREHIQFQLSQDGYDVETAPDGEAGIAAAEGGAFDCVLVDLVMPDPDGIEVCRRISQIRLGTTNPVGIIVLTSQETKEDFAKALEAGADDFVGKSSDLSVLKGRIRALLRRRCYQEENRRIHEELRSKALEAERERAAKEIAEERGKLVGELELTTAELRQSKEAFRKAKEAAECANRSKSDFLANMSHEIRTPMNGVIGMLDLLQGSGLDEERADLVSTALSSAEALLGIINDILDFSKIEAGKLEVELVEFDPIATVESIAGAVASTTADSAVEVLVDHDPGVPNCVVGDPGRVRQILTNLSGNAIKFTSEGRVLIDLRRDRVDEQGRCVLRFSVEDTGIGIDDAKLGTIFEEFTQAEAATTRTHGGTGLGLAISKRLVELMGGEIGVESREGSGSTFWFRLPFEVRAQESSERSPESPLRGRSLVVVDSSRSLRDFVVACATAWGMDAVGFGDCAEALQHLESRSEAPDCIVASDCLPLSRLAPAIEASRPAIISIITAAQTFESGPGGTITPDVRIRKPVASGKLRAALERCLDEAMDRRSRERLVERAPKSTAETADASAAAAQSLDLHILLVEDNAVNQKLASKLIERLGCTCNWACNGREAISLFEDRPYDLVLMDCQMPEMDGFEATREIRRRDGDTHTHTPILALTANAMVDDRANCLAAGMDGHVAKPIRIDALREAIETVMAVETVAQH